VLAELVFGLAGEVDRLRADMAALRVAKGSK
jgi:hypothetical protein